MAVSNNIMLHTIVPMASTLLQPIDQHMPQLFHTHSCHIIFQTQAALTSTRCRHYWNGNLFTFFVRISIEKKTVNIFQWKKKRYFIKSSCNEIKKILCKKKIEMKIIIIIIAIESIVWESYSPIDLLITLFKPCAWCFLNCTTTTAIASGFFCKLNLIEVFFCFNCDFSFSIWRKIN